MLNNLISMNKSLRISILFIGMISSVTIMPFVGSLWIMLFILTFAFLGLLIYTNAQYSIRYSSIMEKSLDKTLMKLDFQADDSYLSDDYLSGIAISESQSKLAILKRNKVSEEFNLLTFNFEDIVECSIKEDGETLVKTSKGLAVGVSLLTGSIGGAIVGGVLANKHSTEQILKATLCIVVDDISNPIHEVHFLNSKMLVSKNSEIYQSIFSDMNKWHKRISVILKRNELNSQSI